VYYDYILLITVIGNKKFKENSSPDVLQIIPQARRKLHTSKTKM
jgi:hypothetical protein